jgi:hypothetical protein
MSFGYRKRKTTMPVSTTIREVFGHFQNLNLLALLHDLRGNRTARQTWADSEGLCPIAHGLAAPRQVQQLSTLEQIADMRRGCNYASQCLRADYRSVLRFVRSWDEGQISRNWLFEQLLELWEERREDAEALQEVLQGCRADRAVLEYR